MNKIWIFIILFSIIFGIINGNTEIMIEELFNVPEEVLYNLFNIGSVLVIYNGLFFIAVKAKIIKKISFLFRGLVKKIFGFEKGSYLNDSISASIIANMLGLGAANTAIAIKVVEEIKKEKGSNACKELTMYLLINISSFVLIPLSMLGLRESMNANINILIVPILVVCSFLTTIFAILLCLMVYK